MGRTLVETAKAKACDAKVAKNGKAQQDIKWPYDMQHMLISDVKAKEINQQDIKWPWTTQRMLSA